MQKKWLDKRCYWIALHLIPGLGSIACKNLLKRFGEPEDILRADLPELLEVEGIRKETALRIVKGGYSADPAKILKRLEENDARLITYHDGSYPPRLKQIHAPPMLLYIKGKDLPKTIFVAIVGSRHPTPYGLKAAEKLSQGLARRGVGVVSGMARGIDSAAHWGCINGRGFTIAVCGTGIDIIYPASNRKLFQKIIENGTVISEFPPETPPEPKNFPIRNRIISGLSKAVVVVEATKNSGSLITASLALDQGRDVFAVPGSINSFKSKGCHYLIKQGAGLIENSDDILEELGYNYRFAQKTDTFKEAPPLPMKAEEKTIYEILGEYPMHIDNITKQSHLESGEVSSTLMRMELKGMIKQLPGKMFVR